MPDMTNREPELSMLTGELLDNAAYRAWKSKSLGTRTTIDADVVVILVESYRTLTALRKELYALRKELYALRRENIILKGVPEFDLEEPSALVSSYEIPGDNIRRL